eukprot:TRINITY_DN7627_c0_g1_i1.p1 TRINITY_DN7627_c0_g1~~TRINITY_DN7627_c0_g1_i1.p1  ORF type:complete len:590 (+),score=106.46 TRINITY_DN7627_c0_g1_i1:40-1809(+)
MADSLPHINSARGSTRAASKESIIEQKEREIAALKRELETLRGRPTEDLPTIRSPKEYKPSPPSTVKSGRISYPSGRTPEKKPKFTAAGTPIEEVVEHPIVQEYRELQESAIRWITADQPFIRTNAAGKGINMCDDISEDFFRSLMNQATFNLPKELRYALAMAKETQDKMQESIAVLAQSQITVDKSAGDTAIDVRNDMDLTRERLHNKELYFNNEVNQFREEMTQKIDTELAIVELLIKTLDNSISQANHVLERNLRPDDDAEKKGGKTLNDLRAEYNTFRRTIMPSMGKNLKEQISGGAAEFLYSERGTNIHEIISGLLATLDSAASKARGTRERLLKHKQDVFAMCAQTLKEIDADFIVFGQKVDEKEGDYISELHNFKEDTTAKISANTLAINDYQSVLAEHMDYAARFLERGNDYQMFKQTKEMKNQMVMMYAELSKMRLQYDGVLFQLASTELDVPLDYLGTLYNASTKKPVDWSPKANKQRMKGIWREQAAEIITREEARAMREIFQEYDKDGNGFVDKFELIAIWRKVWPWASEEEITKVAGRILERVDTRHGAIDFNGFMKLVELPFGEESAEGGAFHV